MVALTATSSQMIGRKTTEETGFDPEKILFSYKKQEIKEFTMKVQNPNLERCPDGVRPQNQRGNRFGPLQQ